VYKSCVLFLASARDSTRDTHENSTNICADDFAQVAPQILVHFPKGIILAIDRWMVHRSAAKRLSLRFSRRVDVEWLPAYAPELNPVKQVWNHSKYAELANFIPENINGLSKAVYCSLRRQTGQQNLLRLFFHYAKLRI